MNAPVHPPTKESITLDDLDELSAMQTRVWGNRLCPLPGESFHTNHPRPILQPIADTCGKHDLLTAACPQEFNNAAGRYPTAILVDILAEAGDAKS